jgi:hypothetical protein
LDNQALCALGFSASDCFADKFYNYGIDDTIDGDYLCMLGLGGSNAGEKE